VNLQPASVSLLQAPCAWLKFARVSFDEHPLGRRPDPPAAFFFARFPNAADQRTVRLYNANLRSILVKALGSASTRFVMFELQLEKNVDTDHVVYGCFASFVVMTLSVLLISLVIGEWLGWWSAEFEDVVKFGAWLLAMFVGGYVAARRSARAGLNSFHTALWVGIFALLFVLINLPEAREGGDHFDRLQNVLLHPVKQWRHFCDLLLTVPAALLGWLISDKVRYAKG
jgi:hypothetical protein